ncbi:hypothetical protein MMC13_008187 [Lambiella insularis]|nr:hypothetical protein [Lambiella insularis]
MAEEVEGFTNLGDAAYTPLDRWGNLRKDFYNHDFKKGSGVWGPELNGGSILLINGINVKHGWRKQGMATQLVRDVLQKATSEEPEYQFAITWPHFLISTEEKELFWDLSEAEGKKFLERKRWNDSKGSQKRDLVETEGRDDGSDDDQI